jgi:hypothetical protein
MQLLLIIFSDYNIAMSIRKGPEPNILTAEISSTLIERTIIGI